MKLTLFVLCPGKIRKVTSVALHLLQYVLTHRRFHQTWLLHGYYRFTTSLPPLLWMHAINWGPYSNFWFPLSRTSSFQPPLASHVEPTIKFPTTSFGPWNSGLFCILTRKWTAASRPAPPRRWSRMQFWMAGVECGTGGFGTQLFLPGAGGHPSTHINGLGIIAACFVLFIEIYTLSQTQTSGVWFHWDGSRCLSYET